MIASAAVLFLLVVGLAACGGGSSSSSSSAGSITGGEAESTGGAENAAAESSGGGGEGLPGSVKIGFLDSMTGPAGFCGQQELQGAELAVELAEKEGLLGDTKVELDVKNDKAAPETAVPAMQDFVNDSSIPVMVGPCVGGVGDATVPIAERSEMPMVLTTASESDISSEWVFRAGMPQQDYVGKVVPLIGEKAENVAVIFDKDQPSLAGPLWGETQKPLIEEEGMSIVAEEPVLTEQTSYTSQVSNIVASNPEAVGVLLEGTPSLTVVKQLREAGYKGLIWGHQGMIAEFYIDGGPDVNGTLIPVSYAPGFKYPSSKRFTEAFEAKFNSEPTELTAHGYDATGVALKALAEAGSTERPAVREALEGIKTYEGAQGPMEFDAEGDARGPGGVVEVKDGKLISIPEK